jgi:hypothetical protein
MGGGSPARFAAVARTRYRLPTRRANISANAAEDRKPRRRIYMCFMLSKRWSCQFLEEDLKTPLPRKLTLEDPAKLFEVAERGGIA